MPDPLLAAECSVAGGGAKDLDGKIGAKGKVHPGPRKGLVFKELPEGTRVVAGHGWDCTKFKKFAEHGPDGEWRDGDGNPVGWWVVKDGSGTWGVYFKTLPYCSYWLSTGNGATAASPAGNKYKTSSSYGVSPCPEFTLLTGQQVRAARPPARTTASPPACLLAHTPSPHLSRSPPCPRRVSTPLTRLQPHPTWWISARSHAVLKG